MQFCAKTPCNAAAVHRFFGCSSPWLPAVNMIHNKSNDHKVEYNLVLLLLVFKVNVKALKRTLNFQFFSLT